MLSSDKPRYESYEFVRSDGERVPQKIAEKLITLNNEILHRDDKQEDKNAYEGSFGNYFAKR